MVELASVLSHTGVPWACADRGIGGRTLVLQRLFFQGAANLCLLWRRGVNQPLRHGRRQSPDAAVGGQGFVLRCRDFSHAQGGHRHVVCAAAHQIVVAVNSRFHGLIWPANDLHRPVRAALLQALGGIGGVDDVHRRLALKHATVLHVGARADPAGFTVAQ